MGRMSSEIESGVYSSSAIGLGSPLVGHQSDGEWPFSSWTAVEGGEGADQNVRCPKKKTTKKKKKQVLLEGYVEATGDEDDLVRTKSLTDEDLDELKGCLDLGFGFSYDEIPELCSTLPALELCYSMSRKFNDESLKSPEAEVEAPESLPEPAASPIASWRISSPGDHPEDVKARLKFWAQAVACTVRLCS
ncbi:uncharacterized protein LOC116196884 [Punica granatum]|uniref:Uncharacterized protein n=2 Tax=Punica granatum TaxID=22663 RepID=A0A218XSY9_PUNGR|nr:uncharacterized protein LOC116196884 [Punica granatum]OWM87928.1 hypothetical protein CDL15_Pgr000345 [Punica granatum]PKI67287.1 hypothetical protein CRG98_012304 [Punica granatum]